MDDDEGFDSEAPDSGLAPDSDQSGAAPSDGDQASDQSAAPQEGQDRPPWAQDAADTPPWEQSPQPQPAPWQQQQPAAPPAPTYDPNLLNEAVTTAREEAIRAHFNAIYSQAATQVEQQAINDRYQATVQSFRVQVREAQLGYREALAQQREQQLMRDLVPMAREYAAQDLARKHKLPLEVVKTDNVTGQPIWDAEHMRRQAEWNAKHGYQQRVQTRRASGADRPLNAGGGAVGETDWGSLSSEEFAKRRAQIRRSGGRYLNVVGQ